MNKNYLALPALMLAITTGTSWAKVPAELAQQLGTSLTPMGAEKSANADGSIPAYTGGLDADKTADPLKDIYADEKPLFVITAENMEQYQDKLSEGQKALLKKYPASFKIPVYPTHRSISVPLEIEEKAKKNATTAELVDGGNGIRDYVDSFPFVMPQSGVEVMWNHMARYRGGSAERNVAQLAVQRNGNYLPIRLYNIVSTPHHLKDSYDPVADDNVMYYFIQQVKSPARMAGSVLLIHETIDQVKEPRRAWGYNTGQRRVRRAPQVAYDAPGVAADGLRTVDQVDMFSGAPDRYDWKLVGKKEMFIPYNAYKLANPELKYDDLVQTGHINQDHTRYEKHRVWMVEATVKDGQRHVYGKRTYYVDEDSWQIVLADHYDNKGNLWRVGEGHTLQFTNVEVSGYVGLMNYDLQSGRYLAEVGNEERKPFTFGRKLKRKAFSTGAIRRMGK